MLVNLYGVGCWEVDYTSTRMRDSIGPGSLVEYCDIIKGEFFRIYDVYIWILNDTFITGCCTSPDSMLQWLFFVPG